MAGHVLLIGWNRPTVGREQQGMELWGKCMDYYGKLQADGRIESFEPVILGPHGGDLNGFILLRGDLEKLNEVRGDGPFLDLMTEAGYCLDGFGVVPGVIGEVLNDQFARWAKLIGG